MKRNIYKILVLLACPLFVLTGCESYLDRQADDALNLQAVFSKRNTTEQYLYHVLSFMPVCWNPAGHDSEYGEAWWPASDEGMFSYNRSYRNINNGSMNPANVAYDRWNRYYEGIREANIFLANVGACTELTSREILIYQSEARFCRAYYYYMLMRQYGPVIIVGNEVLPHENVVYNVARNTWDECVSYVENELSQLASLLPPVPESDKFYGKPTSGAATAVKAQLLLLNASPLFNPREGEDYIYKNVKNPDGRNLFPRAYDADKWRKAAEAAREIINSGTYSLVTSGSVYDNLRNVFYERWNDEIIWGRSADITASWIYGSTPRQFNGYGGHGLTQNHIDAYGMASTGRYPITGYNEQGEPVIDVTSGYQEGSFVEASHPVDNVSYEMNRMYVGRDPRFYMNVIWPAMKMTFSNSPSTAKVVEFYYNSGSGPGKSHDYAAAGYVNRKITRKDNNPPDRSWGTNQVTWSYIRLAEIYLMYAEALNEYDPGNADILTYFNAVRSRAGMPNIETAYPGIAGDQVLMREMIKRERQVELAMEHGQRYFDIRRWMDAESLETTIYGMNVFALNQNPSSGFWKRSVIEKRVFEKKNYLYPISQNELNRNSLIVQNFGW